MKKAKLYKVLLPGGEPAHGGSGKWSLPKGSKPGAWMPTIKKPKCCKRGYHLVTAVQLIQWLDRVELEVWEAEKRGTHHDQDGKGAWSQARLVKHVGSWTDKTARLFAADCAEAVLHIFEKKYPNDDRPHKAIKAARAFAFGKIDAAALAIAWAAAEAAGDAVGNVAWAARAAARAAAWSAAGDAAWAAAEAAEAAAWTTGAAAWAAAGAAGVATMAAARATAEAAGVTAWAARAAWDAGYVARNMQAHRLLYWLKKGKP